MKPTCCVAAGPVFSSHTARYFCLIHSRFIRLVVIYGGRTSGWVCTVKAMVTIECLGPLFQPTVPASSPLQPASSNWKRRTANFRPRRARGLHLHNGASARRIFTRKNDCLSVRSVSLSPPSEVFTTSVPIPGAAAWPHTKPMVRRCPSGTDNRLRLRWCHRPIA